MSPTLSEQDNLEYLVERPEYPVEDHKALEALVSLKSNVIFRWLVSQLEKEAESAAKRMRATPSDVGTFLEREQAVGLERGLLRIGPLVEEHIATLTRKLNQDGRRT